MNGAPDHAFLDLRAADLHALLDGAVVEDAGITLAPVPGAAEKLAGGLDTGALAGPAGIGATAAGDVFLADPEGNRVLWLAPCGNAPVPLPCAELAAPRGVAVAPARGWLLVADSGHGRIVVVDLAARATRGTWGQGTLREPCDLAVDGTGRVYVADRGARRVWRLDADGVLDAAFALGDPAPADPTHVAIAPAEDGERLLVLDGGEEHRLRVYALDGAPDTAATEAWRDALAGLAPGALAAGSATVYVGDRGTGRVLTFAADGRLLAAARWQGACAGLALDAQGRLLVHAGDGAVRLGADAAAEGSFRLGPFAVGDRATAWRRLQVLDAALPEGSHARLFTLTTDDDALVPPPLPLEPGGTGGWRAAPADELDCFIDGPPRRYLWVGGRLQAAAGGAPLLGALRVDFDGDGWLRHLPVVYSRDAAGRDLLDRALAAMESALDEHERLIEDLPLLFDPRTAPDGETGGRWLEWLAGWLAFELETLVAQGDRRLAVAGAFELQGLRGTAEGLRRLVELVLGVEVDVIEPAAAARIWALGSEDAGLGFGTALAAAQPDGAVLDTTAILDRSHLFGEDEYGAPLYDDLAHRFCVRAHAADLWAPGAREALVRIVERERPAHAPAHVCVLEPSARVGFQATVGVDAIVGRGARTPRRGPAVGRVGDTARVGAGARVG
ncbi:MAG TPA: phage tail protein [Solirubrobacteraceae bacterium]